MSAQDVQGLKDTVVALACRGRETGAGFAFANDVVQDLIDQVRRDTVAGMRAFQITHPEEGTDAMIMSIEQEIPSER